MVGGLYRFVRNPMYVAVLAAIAAGEALLLGRWVLVVYWLVAAATMVSFVKGYEEPHLRVRAHGAQYHRYRRAVPGWWPRLRTRHPA